MNTPTATLEAGGVYQGDWVISSMCQCGAFAKSDQDGTLTVEIGRNDSTSDSGKMVILKTITLDITGGDDMQSVQFDFAGNLCARLIYTNGDTDQTEFEAGLAFCDNFYVGSSTSSDTSTTEEIEYFQAASMSDTASGDNIYVIVDLSDTTNFAHTEIGGIIVKQFGLSISSTSANSPSAKYTLAVVTANNSGTITIQPIDNFSMYNETDWALNPIQTYPGNGRRAVLNESGYLDNGYQGSEALKSLVSGSNYNVILGIDGASWSGTLAAGDLIVWVDGSSDTTMNMAWSITYATVS